MKPIKWPAVPASVTRKGVVPAALIAALTGPLAVGTLVRWEGDIHRVYADRLADNLPTFCAGRTDTTAVVGTVLTSDFCERVNRTTLVEYGYHVLGCTTWKHLTPERLVGLTTFAINVGKAGACNSAAVRNINAGRIKEGCDLIAYKPSGQPNWSFVGSRFVQGLHNRRLAERDLCLRGLT